MTNLQPVEDHEIALEPPATVCRLPREAPGPHFKSMKGHLIPLIKKQRELDHSEITVATETMLEFVSRIKP